jgi:precorrin-4 methylase
MNQIASKLFKCLALLAALAVLGLVPGAASAQAGERGKFYVIGIGPAGPQTATLQALEAIKKMDAIMAYGFHAKLFAEYIGKTPVTLNPLQGLWDYKGKPYGKLTEKEKAEFRIERFKVRDKNVAHIKELLAQGKNVGFLDSGNPCVFGPGHWYTEFFAPEDLVIIPGMGSDSAAMAVLKRSALPAHGTRFLVHTAPFYLFGRGSDISMNFDPDSPEGKKAMADLAKHDHTMIIYMGLGDPVKLFKTLGRYLPADMPAACVFYAGFPGKERVTRGTVGDIGPRLAKDKERLMGLVCIGRFLEGRPYEAAMKRYGEDEK